MRIDYLIENLKKYPPHFEVLLVYQGSIATVLDDIGDISNNGGVVRLVATEWLEAEKNTGGLLS